MPPIYIFIRRTLADVIPSRNTHCANQLIIGFTFTHHIPSSGIKTLLTQTFRHNKIETFFSHSPSKNIQFRSVYRHGSGIL